MNGILRLKHIQDFEKVKIYSVCIDDEDVPIEEAYSLFELFLKTHEIKNKEKLNHILSWLREIGNKYGALEYYFRPEQNQGEAMGLPPRKASIEPVYTEDGEITSNPLRLYCHRLNESAVILFNGNIKTAETAQNCPQVKPHFELANKLTIAIDNAFKDGDIIWIKNNSDIDYSEDLILYF